MKTDSQDKKSLLIFQLQLRNRKLLRLSIVIPVYNEIKTLSAVLQAVVQALPGVKKQIVLVDDCSTDGTRELLIETALDGQTCSNVIRSEDGKIVLETRQDKDDVEIRCLFHDRNRGKGAALRTGFAAVNGDVVVIQDADLEYDPNDWQPMYALIAQQGVADVVYGSRFFGQPHRSLNYHHYLANRLISFLTNALYNQTLSDIETCYKMFRRDVLNSMELTSNDFGIEVEITAKISLARKWRIYEVGISYFGRSYDEGKKINWKDGVLALWYIILFRFKK